MTTPSASARRERFGQGLSIGVALVLIGALVVVVVDRWEQIAPGFGEIGALRLAVAFALFASGVVLTAECWRRWLSSLGARASLLTSHRLFYLTQAAKYLPGSVWPFAAQAAVSRRFGIPRSSILTASGLFLVTHTVTAALVASASIGTMIGDLAPLAVVVALLALATLTPPGLTAALKLVRRIRPSAFGQVEVMWTTTSLATSAMVLAWACFGVATFLIVQPLGLELDGLPIAVGAYALGWLVGFLIIPAPAGFGPREAAFVAVLAPFLGTDPALAAALVTRAMVTAGDLGLAALSAPVLKALPEPVE